MAGHVLLVTDTRAEHSLNDGQPRRARVASCDAASAALGVSSLRDVDVAGLEASLVVLSDDVLRRRARHVVTEIARVEATVAALRGGDPTEVGRLFDESHTRCATTTRSAAPSSTSRFRRPARPAPWGRG